MKPAPFAYFDPRTVAEAVDLLARYGEDAKVLAGGQSLLPLLNFRLARPAVLVDVNRVANLDGIREEGGGVAVGATARQADVSRAPAVATQCPVLADTIQLVGHAAIRHRGTVVGSLAHADPVAELPMLAVALDARLISHGPGGERTHAARDFFLSYLTTALGPDELLTGTWFPALPPRTGWSVRELARRHGDFAIVAVVAVLTLTPDGRVAAARVALAGVGDTPVRADAAEAGLVGQQPTPNVLADVADLVTGAIDPGDDLHATADYRRAVAREYTYRTLTEAAARARTAAGLDPAGA